MQVPVVGNGDRIDWTCINREMPQQPQSRLDSHKSSREKAMARSLQATPTRVSMEIVSTPFQQVPGTPLSLSLPRSILPTLPGPYPTQSSRGSIQRQLPSFPATGISDAKSRPSATKNAQSIMLDRLAEVASNTVMSLTEQPPKPSSKVTKNTTKGSTGIHLRDIHQEISSIEATQSKSEALNPSTPSFALKKRYSFRGPSKTPAASQPGMFTLSPLTPESSGGPSSVPAAHSGQASHASPDGNPTPIRHASLRPEAFGVSTQAAEHDEDMDAEDHKDQTESDFTEDERMTDRSLNAGFDQEVLIGIGPDKRFKCRWKGCKLSFKRKWDCKQHIKGVHFKFRPHKCTEVNCARRFGTKGSLNKHIRVVHDKVRAFECPHPNCGMQFGERGNLNKHIKRKHSNLP